MASAGLMNRGAIVTEALQFGNNPGITTRVNNFLNLLLDHMARSYDFPQLLKEATFSIAASATSFNLPSDYNHVQIVQLDNATYELKQRPLPEVWQKQRIDIIANQKTASSPEYFGVDVNGSKALVWPISSVAWNGRMLYYFQPASGNNGIPAADSDFPWFTNSLALVTACSNYVEAYERETMQQLVDQEAKRIMQMAMNNLVDIGRAGPNNLELDHSTFGRWSYRES